MINSFLLITNFKESEVLEKKKTREAWISEIKLGEKVTSLGERQILQYDSH